MLAFYYVGKTKNIQNSIIRRNKSQGKVHKKFNLSNFTLDKKKQNKIAVNKKITPIVIFPAANASNSTPVNKRISVRGNVVVMTKVLVLKELSIALVGLVITPIGSGILLSFILKKMIKLIISYYYLNVIRIYYLFEKTI